MLSINQKVYVSKLEVPANIRKHQTPLIAAGNSPVAFWDRPVILHQPVLFKPVTKGGEKSLNNISEINGPHAGIGVPLKGKELHFFPGSLWIAPVLLNVLFFSLYISTGSCLGTVKTDVRLIITVNISLVKVIINLRVRYVVLYIINLLMDGSIGTINA